MFCRQCPTHSDQPVARRRPYKLLTLTIVLLGLALLLPAGAFASNAAGWNPEWSGVPEDVDALAFPNASDGWMVGYDGTILATTDGGATWKTQRSGADERLSNDWLNAVAFPNASDGWVVGATRDKNNNITSTIRATTDGGSTWTDQNPGATEVLNGVAFPNASDGWAVGETAPSSPPADGGATWKTQSSGTADPSPPSASPTPLHGWAVGASGTILATTDGGATWKTQRSGTADASTPSPSPTPVTAGRRAMTASSSPPRRRRHLDCPGLRSVCWVCRPRQRRFPQRP